MDKTTLPDAPSAENPSLTGYTLYPDAGDFTGLDTTAPQEISSNTQPAKLFLPFAPPTPTSPPQS
ncbi:MAG: hypothetical protein IJB15_00235, partial [Clostridia bacterium]|nr:hypothetical protein [Clostridia bacterium]